MNDNNEQKIDYRSGRIFTHNGKVTIFNPATGNHRTFKIKTQAPDANFAPGERILSLLTGPDNQNDYKGLGFIDNRYNTIRLWKKQRNATNEAYCKMLLMPEKFQEEHDLEYLFSCRCRVCNRELTDPTSIQLGIGPVCRGEK